MTKTVTMIAVFFFAYVCSLCALDFLVCAPFNLLRDYGHLTPLACGWWKLIVGLPCLLAYTGAYWGFLGPALDYDPDEEV